jgi:UDP-GlcNAc:undecaprenyl-phosphate GlcNAc-1-phosphate transferase
VNGVGGLEYLGIFAGSLTLSLLLVPLALRYALRREVLDHPGGYKQQEQAVPYLGGAAMLLAFAAVIAGAAIVRPPVTGLDELLVILGAAVLLGIMGLVDDLRGLGVVVRIAVTVAAGVALYASGTQIELFGTPWVDGPLTVVWIVGIVNAMNLLDNMDGLSAGVAVIAASTFFIIAALNGQFLIAALSIALVGCAAGFLRHNRYPARIYMGDAGSLFLGLMLAVIAIRLRFGAPQQVTIFVPFVVLAVPILDTALVTITRLHEGRSVFQGGADHTSHRLVRLGLPVPGAVGLIYAGAVFSSWLAVVISRQTDVLSAYLLVGLWTSVAAMAGWFLVRTTRQDVIEAVLDPDVGVGVSGNHPRADEVQSVDAVTVNDDRLEL